MTNKDRTFEVGDRVRLRPGFSSSILQHGQIYTVLGTDQLCGVSGVLVDGAHGILASRELELVEPAGLSEERRAPASDPVFPLEAPADPKAALYAKIEKTAMSGRTIRREAELRATEPVEETWNELHFDASLEDIQRQAWLNSERHGFHGTATDSELFALIASEAFEAFEVTREAGPMTENKRVRIAEELADIVIRCGDVATILEIDLGQAVQLKHCHNLTRPFRHGKAK